MGTVSTWAESIRRGPRIVPGSFSDQIADLAAERRAAMGIVDRECALRRRRLRVSLPRMKSMMAASSPLRPGIAIISITSASASASLI